MFSWKEFKNLPIVVAHRGDSAKAPENTLTAFRMAVREGTDAIELDVHLTKDKQVAVIHDNKIDRTTDSIGFVSQYSLSQLKNFNAAYLWRKEYPFESIPALEEVLSEFGNKIGINIEIKNEKTVTAQNDLLMKCLEMVSRYKLSESVLFSSFSSRVIKRIGELDCTIISGLLYDPVIHVLKSPVSFAKSLGVRYLIMNNKIIRKSIVKSVHEKDMLIGEFTVNTNRQMERSIRYGVDMIITNQPAQVVAKLRR